MARNLLESILESARSASGIDAHLHRVSTPPEAHSRCPADFGDGIVDVADLLSLLGTWGAC